MGLVTGYSETHRNERCLERASGRSEQQDYKDAVIIALRAEVERLKALKVQDVIVEVFNNTGEHIDTIDAKCVLMRNKENSVLDIHIHQK